MADTGALKPSFFSQIPSLAPKPEKLMDQLSEEEKQLAAMSNSTGWMALKIFIESVMQDLDTLTENSIASAANYDEVGQKAVVASLAKGLLRQVIRKVEDAKEAVEGQNGL
jgi:hypothetical protein